MAPRYLIIGASGFAGARLFALLGPQLAIATFNSRPVAGGVVFNADRERLGDAILKRYRGLTHAFVFHGITNIDDCARDPRGSARVNVDSVCAVIDDVIEHGIVPIFASSDAVFDGMQGMRTEEDPARPILTYGRQKLKVEEHLRGKSSPWLVARFAKLLGNVPGHVDMLGEWMDKLESGAQIRCARDQRFSPVDVDDALHALIRLAEGNFTGLFHVCGRRAVTRWELLETLIGEVRRYRVPATNVVSCSLHDLDLVEPRPLDTSMSPRKLYGAVNIRFDELGTVCRKAAARRYSLAATGRAYHQKAIVR
jgi:dTDP-4-dehydrorhamnose reductase